MCLEIAQQWNLSIKDPLNIGRLSIKDTYYRPTVILYCIT